MVTHAPSAVYDATFYSDDITLKYNPSEKIF